MKLHLVYGPEKENLVYGYFQISDRVTPIYRHQVILAPDAAAALSRYYCGDDRAAGMRGVFARTAHDARRLECIVFALTGRRSAVEKV